MNKLERNKENAMAFYAMAFNENDPRRAMERFAGADYKQHNPMVASGKEPFIAYFEKMAKEFPGKEVIFKRAVAEGDLVVLHCQQKWPTDKDKEWATIDIFRCDENGKIVEHWDVIQPVPKTQAHQNTMF